MSGWPLCPTCDGGDNGTGLREECPDCVDGSVPIERLIAVFKAVGEDIYTAPISYPGGHTVEELHIFDAGVAAVYRRLRSVRAEEEEQ